jgi:hypothetical protein
MDHNQSSSNKRQGKTGNSFLWKSDLLRPGELLGIIVLIAAILLIISALLHRFSEPSSWGIELSKSLLGLGITAIIGGILVKILIEDYQKRKDRSIKKAEFLNELLNRLRKVFDQVDLSRILIKAHRSAKTYGEVMRDRIMPAAVELYDIKRTLKDNKGSHISTTQQDNLRVGIHYMLAYLKMLIAVYEADYPALSNLQYLHEKMKERVAKAGVDSIEVDLETLNDLPNAFYTQRQWIKALVRLSRRLWKKIEALEYLRDFIDDSRDTKYYQVFIKKYEYCKRILKDDQTVQTTDDEFHRYLAQLNYMDKNDLFSDKDSLLRMISRDKFSSNTTYVFY